MTTSEKQWKSHGMRSPREDCNAAVDFVIEGRAYMGMVKSKSETGAYVDAMESFEVGQELTLTFTPPGSRKPIKKKGELPGLAPLDLV